MFSGEEVQTLFQQTQKIQMLAASRSGERNYAGRRTGGRICADGGLHLRRRRDWTDASSLTDGRRSADGRPLTSLNSAISQLPFHALKQQ